MGDGSRVYLPELGMGARPPVTGSGSAVGGAHPTGTLDLEGASGTAS